MANATLAFPPLNGVYRRSETIVPDGNVRQKHHKTICFYPHTSASLPSFKDDDVEYTIELPAKIEERFHPGDLPNLIERDTMYTYTAVADAVQAIAADVTFVDDQVLGALQDPTQPAAWDEQFISLSSDMIKASKLPGTTKLGMATLRYTPAAKDYVRIDRCTKNTDTNEKVSRVYVIRLSSWQAFGRTSTVAPWYEDLQALRTRSTDRAFMSFKAQRHLLRIQPQNSIPRTLMHALQQARALEQGKWMDPNVFAKPVLNIGKELALACIPLTDREVEEVVKRYEQCHCCTFEYIENGQLAVPEWLPIVKYPCGLEHYGHFGCLKNFVISSMSRNENPSNTCPQCRRTFEIDNKLKNWPRIQDRYPESYAALVAEIDRQAMQPLNGTMPAVPRDPQQIVSEMMRIMKCDSGVEPGWSVSHGARGWDSEAPEPRFWIAVDTLRNPARSPDARRFMQAIEYSAKNLHTRSAEGGWDPLTNIDDIRHEYMDNLAEILGEDAPGLVGKHLSQILTTEVYAWVYLRLTTIQKMYMPRTQAEQNTVMAVYRVAAPEEADEINVGQMAEEGGDWVEYATLFSLRWEQN